MSQGPMSQGPMSQGLGARPSSGAYGPGSAGGPGPAPSGPQSLNRLRRAPSELRRPASSGAISPPRPELRAPGSAPLSSAPSQLEQELNGLRNERAQLLKALREREHALAERESQYRGALSNLRREQAEELEALKKSLAAAQEAANQASLTEKRLDSELGELRARMKRQELEAEERLKQGINDVQARMQKRAAAEKVSDSGERQELQKELEQARERAEKSEKAAAALRSRVEQKDKEFKDLIVRSRRSTQHALRSAVLKAEERQRESLAHHQEQARVLEKELRQVKEDYDARLNTEREESRQRLLKISEDLTKLRRESSLARNEADQVRKLWRKSEEQSKEASEEARIARQRIEALEAELTKLRAVLDAQPQMEGSPLSAEEAKKALEELETYKGEALAKRALVSELEDRIRRSQSELDSMTSALEEARARLAAREQELAQDVNKQSSLESQTIAELRAQLDRAEASLRSEREASAAALEAAERQRLQTERELELRSEQIQALEELHQAALFSLEVDRESIRAAEARAIKLETEHRIALGLSEKRLRAELGNLERRASEFEARARDLSEINARQASELAGLERLKLELEERLQRAELNMLELNEARNAALATERAQNELIEQLREQLARLDQEHKAALASLSAGGQGSELQNALRSLREDHERSRLEQGQVLLELVKGFVGNAEQKLNEQREQERQLEERWQSLVQQALAPPPPPPEEAKDNERWRAMVEDLRARLGRTEDQLRNLQVEDRSRSESTRRRAIWPDEQDLHGVLEQELPHYSAALHQAEAMLENPETQRQLCLRLWRAWPPFAALDGMRSPSSRALTVLESLLNRLERLRRRLAPSAERDSDSDSTAPNLESSAALVAVEAFQKSLRHEREKLQELDLARADAVEQAARPRPESTALARLAELAVADLRIHSELIRLGHAIEALESLASGLKTGSVVSPHHDLRDRRLP
jgi:chromosome segregation ATPase